MTSEPSLQSAHQRCADNDAPFRFQHRWRPDFVPTSQRLLPSIWRHRNEQRRKRHGQTMARLPWPFGSVQSMLQRLGLLVSSSRFQRDGTNAAISNASVLVPLAIGLGMQVRGFHWPSYLTPIQLRRRAVGGERSSKSCPNVYKLSICSHNDALILHALFPRNFIQTNTKL